jgi:subtilisin family serine protease
VTTLAGYSTVGNPVDVTAPGGDAVQTPNPFSTRGRILAGWSSTDETGFWEAIDALGRTAVSGGGRYAWVSGTSMASPHAAGVAALVKENHPDWGPGPLAAALRSSATSMPCPEDWPETDPRTCFGKKGNNSFFGKGIVNAEAAANK